MKVLLFLFRYSPRFMVLATVIGMLGGLASTAVLAIINNHLREVLSTRQDEWRFLCLCAAILLANMASRVCIAGLAQWSAFDLRLQLGRKWVSSPLPALESDGSTKMIAAITNDVDRMAEAMHVLPGMCIDITVIATCICYLGYLSMWMLAIMAGFIAVALATRHVPQKRCDALLGEARTYNEEMIATFNAMKGGIKELKMNIARWNAFYVGELYEISAQFRDRQYRAELIFGVVRGYSEIIYFLFVGILLYAHHITGDLSLKVVVGFAVTLLYVKTNIDHVQDNVSQMTRAKIALGNLESLGVIDHNTSLTIAQLRLRSSREKVALDLAEDSQLRDLPPPALITGLSLRGVEYRYGYGQNDSTFAIGPIDLTIRPGELIFVVGGNGSGKTTFAKVLCGLYLPESGSITLDGVALNSENSGWYSQYFGTIFSDSYLFDKLYGGDGLPQGDLIVNEYLKELKLQDKVGVVGGRFTTTSLSQGQRKRLALVTAYVEDRPIYLFDEWAADQDPEFREFFYHRILPGLKQKGKTLVVISHDDRYYGAADRVIKFDNGMIVSDTSAKRLSYA